MLHSFGTHAGSKALFLSSVGLLDHSNAPALDSKASLLQIMRPHARSIVPTLSSYVTTPSSSASHAGCNRFLFDIPGPLLCSVGSSLGSNAPRAFSYGLTRCSFPDDAQLFGLLRCSNRSPRHFLGSLLYSSGPHRCFLRARACYNRATDYSFAPHSCSSRPHHRSNQAVGRSGGTNVILSEAKEP